jgi:hypothetical protein
MSFGFVQLDDVNSDSELWPFSGSKVRLALQMLHRFGFSFIPSSRRKKS